VYIILATTSSRVLLERFFQLKMPSRIFNTKKMAPPTRRRLTWVLKSVRSEMTGISSASSSSLLSSHIRAALDPVKVSHLSSQDMLWRMMQAFNMISVSSTGHNCDSR
jgi:hypothetical protein